ncbi:MAG: glucose-6-phosphate isomerase [Alphaproteobacteria bacterium]|nr:glucose-6-phosphate isomerase [Alphaproteobacteria bacterium]
MSENLRLPAYQALTKHFEQNKQMSLRQLFEKDPQRFQKMSLLLEDMLLDFSKNLITDETLQLLCQWAQEARLADKREALFQGQKINFSQHRAVLHTALRNRTETPIIVDGKNIMPEINEVLEKMKIFSDLVRSGMWKGYTGHAIQNVVNIGIGGSDLGPKMAVEALRDYQPSSLTFHFVSNVDKRDLERVLETCQPDNTLFLIASKTFTTQETMINARSARKWLTDALGEDAVKNHFVAMSTNIEAVREFGIDERNSFAFWDFVGGRFSVWGAVGLSLMIAIGYDNFIQFLEGACEMDRHFYREPFEKNAPVILGLLSLWYSLFYKAESAAVLPYDEGLKYLPAYLQQIEMESNGKDVDAQRQDVTYPTGVVVFGETGTNGQHSFYQLLHQGTHLIPCDFIVPINRIEADPEHQLPLLANALAQSEALMRGKTAEELRQEQVPEDEIPFRCFKGNHPSNSILIEQLTPKALGRLMALYEHKVFVVGAMLNIDSFDQWGVELGKQLAKKILPELQAGTTPAKHDASTQGQIDFVKAQLR